MEQKLDCETQSTFLFKTPKIYKREIKMIYFMKTEKRKLSKEAKLAILLQAFNIQTLGHVIYNIKLCKPIRPIFSSQRRKMWKLVLAYNPFSLS